MDENQIVFHKIGAPADLCIEMVFNLTSYQIKTIELPLYFSSIKWIKKNV